MTAPPSQPVMDLGDPSTTYGESGRALWRSVTADFDLNEGELALLRSACLAADLIDELTAIIASEGPLVASGQVHPAVVERRQQQLLLGRLLVALRVPAGDEGELLDGPRPQRRGMRGFYGPRDMQ